MVINLIALRVQRLARCKHRHVAHLSTPEVQCVQRLTRCKHRHVAHLGKAEVQHVKHGREEGRTGEYEKIG
jgi:hypothetical protein